MTELVEHVEGELNLLILQQRLQTQLKNFVKENSYSELNIFHSYVNVLHRKYNYDNFFNEITNNLNNLTTNNDNNVEMFMRNLSISNLQNKYIIKDLLNFLDPHSNVEIIIEEPEQNL